MTLFYTIHQGSKDAFGIRHIPDVSQHKIHVIGGWVLCVEIRGLTFIIGPKVFTREFVWGDGPIRNAKRGARDLSGSKLRCLTSRRSRKASVKFG